MPAGSSFRLRPAESSLLVIDVQDKLLPAIAETPRLLRNIVFLLDAGRLLDVPALATEQYPSGLGRTAPVLAERLPAERPAKLDFSCCGVPDLLPRLRQGGRSSRSPGTIAPATAASRSPPENRAN